MNNEIWFKRIVLIGLMLVFFSVQASTGIQPSVQAQESENMERPLFLTHYMPWYQTPEVNGYWGWHWTMDFFHPDIINDEGRPEIASHYLPLTGPYDSQDDDVLEYQVLLMKLSGIDGVIVDWYGTEDFRDYAVINEATGRLFEYIQRAGLIFTICYEDATVRNMINEGYLDGGEALAHGQGVLNYLQETWFNDESYLRYEDQPILFVFGPQNFRTPNDWEVMSEGLETPPALVTLDGHMDWAALSSYPWPPMSMAGGATLAPTVLEAYLDLFYRNAHRKDIIVGSAFPGFHDIYEEAGNRSSYGFLDRQEGETFRYTLNAALENGARIIQLVTWNDYGEGTMIEPTEEYGYEYLEIVQETRQTLDSVGFSYTAEDLRLPLQLYNLRKRDENDDNINALLDQVFESIVADEFDSAREILAEFERE